MGGSNVGEPVGRIFARCVLPVTHPASYEVIHTSIAAWTGLARGHRGHFDIWNVEDSPIFFLTGFPPPCYSRNIGNEATERG